MDIIRRAFTMNRYAREISRVLLVKAAGIYLLAGCPSAYNYRHSSKCLGVDKQS